jgi:hypothetical protein
MRELTDSQKTVLRFVTQAGIMAADLELLKPVPVSRVRAPGGGEQGETAAERTSRAVGTAVWHLVEQRLLDLPDDLDERMAGGVPVMREGTER